MSGKRISSMERVLGMLSSSQGAFVSGEELAAELGISRTAVWKAVSKLRSEGYSIEAVTNRGYRLSENSDVLSEYSIRSYLQEIDSSSDTVNNSAVYASGSGASITLDVFEKVDSTNTVCMQKAAAGERGLYAAIAGCQTHGRGRRGRSFFSPDGTGLYMSILLRPSGVAADIAMRFTTIAAVAVAEAIEVVSGRQADIKWVNDIYMEGRKVCGILTEAAFNPETLDLDYAIVGIGINVYEPQGGFPEEIRDLAGAVAGSPDSHDRSREIIRQGGRNRLAAGILSAFLGYLSDEDPARRDSSDSLSDAGPGRYVQEYRKRCFVIGKDIDVIRQGSSPRAARVLDIDDECRLLVRYDDGSEEALNSGEISIRI